MQHSEICHNIDGLVQDCSNSIANALELLQSCTKPRYMDYEMCFVPIVVEYPPREPLRRTVGSGSQQCNDLSHMNPQSITLGPKTEQNQTKP